MISESSLFDILLHKTFVSRTKLMDPNVLVDRCQPGIQCTKGWTLWPLHHRVHLGGNAIIKFSLSLSCLSLCNNGSNRKPYCSNNISLFVWVFFVPLKNFSLIWWHHHYLWMAANFDLCSTVMAFKQWGFLACHTYSDTGHPLITVISEDPWHSNLLLSGYQGRCHYLFSQLRSVAAGIRTPSLPLSERTLLPTGPPLRSNTISAKWKEALSLKSLSLSEKSSKECKATINYFDITNQKFKIIQYFRKIQMKKHDDKLNILPVFIFF